MKTQFPHEDPVFLRIDFRSAPRIGKARAMVLVMRVDWCV